MNHQIQEMLMLLTQQAIQIQEMLILPTQIQETPILPVQREAAKTLQTQLVLRTIRQVLQEIQLPILLQETVKEMLIIQIFVIQMKDKNCI